MSEPLQLPPPPDDHEEEEEPKQAIVPRKGRTVKEADRALKKFGAKYIKATQATGLAEFGHFVIGRGTKASGIAWMMYAAHSAKNSVESCDDLIQHVDNPELKVRLQENKVRLIEQVGKIGKDLANTDDGEAPTPTVKQPSVSVFPPNTKVEVSYVAAPTEKQVSS